jgi:putative ABC transport system permease protein
MLRNLLKQTLRGIGRDKFHSLINIFGLGLGIACCIIGLLFLRSELTFDRHHQKHTRIFRYGVEMTIGGVTSIQSTCNPGAGPLLKDFIPEIESFTRIGYLGEIQVRHEDRAFAEEDFLWADSDFFSIFTYPFIRGNPRDALVRPNTAVLTRTTARKIFGRENPIGQVVEIENQGPFEVTGIIADPPDNEQLRFTALLSFSTLFKGREEAEIYQPARLSGGMDYDLYFLFAPGFTVADFDRKAELFYQKYQAATDTIHYRSLVEPLDEVHLRSTIDSGQAAANARFLYWFGGVVLLILFLAGVNYVNLTTARAGRRAKEIGVRKVAGASHAQLVGHLLGESLLFVLLSVVAGVLLAWGILVFTPLNHVIGKDLRMDPLTDPLLLAGLPVVWLVVGLLAGLYPAFYLARMAPVKTIKSGSGGQRRGRFVRQGLLMLQFVISIGAIAMTLLMTRQMDFMKTKDLGFRHDHVVVVKVTDAEVLERIGAFKEELSRYPGVSAAAFSSAVPGWGFTGFAFKWETESGEMKPHAFPSLQADPDFFPAMGIPLVQGRNFSRLATAADRSNNSLEVIVNESLVRKLGWTNPIGKRCRVGTVIGVVRDFHFHPLQYELRPLFITAPVGPAPYLSVRIRADRVRETLDLLRTRWQAVAPGRPFFFTFLDERLARLYQDDEKQQRLATIFSTICLLISGLGLFALASFTIGQRTKEIGIRRALGASLTSVVLLLNRRFAFWVLLANLVAWPLTYLGMHQWLESFAYRTSIGIGVFLLAGGSVLLVAMLTVSVQSVRAARANPVDSLRYE